MLIPKTLEFYNNKIVGNDDSRSNKKTFKSKKSLSLKHAFNF